ncbi:hypothetical protein PROAA_1030010 [Candidatus Propionivibrio aalborgensis]|uniref:Uncharacterized protein n=1 Tax=Candidatus Propionivibrio aalborgensis TaxID=1860101 RepID=A0A1A8XDQ3_9RHOO|nr:hypothetical protein PROAA_1030010 [Candidatus Propionivibrio aalborgensis]
MQMKADFQGLIDAQWLDARPGEVSMSALADMTEAIR